MTQQRAISLWQSSAQEPDIEAPLPGDTETELAIVGGGYTGLSTALHAAERGIASLVIEAHRIGHGGSGRNVGLVNAGVWHPPAAVRRALGPTYGPRFIETFGAAPAYVFSLIEKHQIRCEVTREGTIHAAHAPSGMRNLRARYDEWARLGAPVDLLTREEVTQMTGTRAYVGGLLDHRAGTINPMGYCRGLARAALGAGAKIHTGTKVTRLVRDGQAWVLETSKGRVRARHVVLGTNAYTDTLWPDLKRVFTIIQYVQFATEPMDDRLNGILAGRQGLWDTAPVMTSLRRDADDRLIVGSMGAVWGEVGRGLSHRWAKRRLEQLFPRLGPVTFEEAWHGDIAMTPDHLPRICRLADNLYTAIGYNGRGVTTGTIFGKALAGLVAGDDPGTLPLPISTPRPVPAAAARSQFYRLAFAANQFVRSL